MLLLSAGLFFAGLAYLSSAWCWTPGSGGLANAGPRPDVAAQADPLVQSLSPQLEETRFVDPLPSSAAVAGLHGVGRPMAVRATQAVHVQRPQVQVVEDKETSYLGKDRSVGQFAPGVLDRIKMRLEGQGTYAVISALVVNMGIRLLSGNSPEMLRQAWWPISCAYSCALATCVLSGVYATVVFTLTKMYAMTVIGNYKDAQFCKFFQETQKYRAAGFRAFCASLGSFAFAFVTFFLLKIQGWPGIAGFAVGVAIVMKGMFDFHGIYRRAGKTLK